MATKTAHDARQRTIADFPQVDEAQRRLGALQAKWNEAREQLAQITAGMPKPSHVRDEDHVNALLAGEDPDAIDLEAVKQYHRRVAEQEKIVSLLARALEQQQHRVDAVLGEASGQILRERKPEFVARMRAVISAAIQLIRAAEEERAFRFSVAQDGVSGAEACWALPFWPVDQLGSVSEADSSVVRILREAQAVGALTNEEVATIRAGGDFTA